MKYLFHLKQKNVSHITEYHVSMYSTCIYGIFMYIRYTREWTGMRDNRKLNYTYIHLVSIIDANCSYIFYYYINYEHPALYFDLLDSIISRGERVPLLFWVFPSAMFSYIFPFLLFNAHFFHQRGP